MNTSMDKELTALMDPIFKQYPVLDTVFNKIPRSPVSHHTVNEVVTGKKACCQVFQHFVGFVHTHILAEAQAFVDQPWDHQHDAIVWEAISTFANMLEKTFLHNREAMTIQNQVRTVTHTQPIDMENPNDYGLIYLPQRGHVYIAERIVRHMADPEVGQTYIGAVRLFAYCGIMKIKPNMELRRYRHGRRIEIKQCHGCPCLNNDYEQGYTCNHPDAPHMFDMYILGNDLPFLCPLRKEPLTISL